MGKYLKKFENHSDYETYISGQDAILPNVSFCKQQNEVHYNPWVETRLVAVFNVTSTSEPTPIMYKYGTASDFFTEMEVDGVVLPSVTTSYQFDTTGKHTVKYTLADPTNIGQAVFHTCNNLISVIIPNSVISIGGSAFPFCSDLISVTIGNNVTSIGGSAFQSCTSLTDITIPNSVTSIGGSAFSSCTSLTNVTIGDSVTNIDSWAFGYCSNLSNIISLSLAAPTIISDTFQNVKSGGTLYVPQGSTGYNTWMGTGNYYLGKYNWTKVEQ